MLFLKELAYEYILLHDNLTKEEKLQVGVFVKNASDEQVMALLLTGECKQLQEGEADFAKQLFNIFAYKLCELTGDFSSGVVQSGMGGGMAWMRRLASKWADYKAGTETIQGPFGVNVRMPKDMESWAGSYDSAIKNIKSGTPVAALVMAALVILVASRAYKKYFSEAAKACKGKGSKELIQKCVKQYKLKALKAQLMELQSSIKACDTTKKPDKCRKAINKKIMKIKQKI
ncbi:MAG: hypothetical protein ACFFG0_02055 [Candidatus Thorarchaeota archaeon]